MVTYRARTPSSGIRRRAWAKSACVSRHSAPQGPHLRAGCDRKLPANCAQVQIVPRAGASRTQACRRHCRWISARRAPQSRWPASLLPPPLRVRPQLLREDTAALPPLVRRRWHGAYPQWRQGAYALWSSFTIERSTSLTAWRRARGVSRGTTRCHNHTTRCCLVSHFSSRLTDAKITCLTLSLFRSRMRDALGLHIDVFP